MNKKIIAAVASLFLLNSVCVHSEEFDYGVIQMGVICSGGFCCPSEINQSIVRVAVASPKTNSYGSGTLIYYQNRVYLLTCAHLFENATDYATVQFSKQVGCPVQPLAIDREYDLAVLDMSIPGALPSGAEPVKLTATIPLPGARVYAAGYGPNGIFKVTVATVNGYVQVQGADARDTLQAVYDRKGATVRFGDSGGGVFNQSGELVATLWGSDNQCLYGSQIGRIRYFLKSVIPEPKPKPVPKPAPTIPYPDLSNTENEQLSPIFQKPVVVDEAAGLSNDSNQNSQEDNNDIRNWFVFALKALLVIVPWAIILWLYPVKYIYRLLKQQTPQTT